MTIFKNILITLIFLLIIACGGTTDKLDYTQITDDEMMQLANTKMANSDYKGAIKEIGRASCRERV